MIHSDGSVANTEGRVEWRYCCAVVLRSDAEDLMNETNLTVYIAFGQPSHLPFFDQAQGFMLAKRDAGQVHVRDG
jgi:hypothetical protein